MFSKRYLTLFSYNQIKSNGLDKDSSMYMIPYVES